MTDLILTNARVRTFDDTQPWAEALGVTNGRISYVVRGLVLPGLGTVISIGLWFSLEPSAMIVGAVWVVLGIVFLLWRTRLFRVPPPALAGPIEAERDPIG